MDEEIKELISRRRRQILIHSCIYYRLNDSIIDDKQFDAWAYQLVALQETYPNLAAQCPYHDEFKGFDGTTGFNLPMYGRILEKAQHLLRTHKEREKNENNKP